MHPDTKDLVQLGHHCQSSTSFHCINFSLLLGNPLGFPRGLRGLGLKGGAVPPGVHLAIPPSPLMFPSTIMGTHTATLLVCATRVTSPPEVMSSPPAAWRVVCGCCFYEGLGHWLGVGGSFRSTLGSLRPLSGLCSLGKYQFFYFLFSFFFTWTTCKI